MMIIDALRLCVYRL